MWSDQKKLYHHSLVILSRFPADIKQSVTGLFDLNHFKKSLIFDLFTSNFFNHWFIWITNNCLHALWSTKFCMFFNTKAHSAHTCVAVLTPDSLIVKYFMSLCVFKLFPFWMQWSHTNLSSSQNPWVKVHLELVLVVTNSVYWLKWDSLGYTCLILYQFAVWLETLRVHKALVLIHPLSKQ